MRELPPSPWLRLLRAAARRRRRWSRSSRARAGWDAAHQLLSALALPPLVAVALAAWLGHRRLLVPALVSIALFGARRPDHRAGAAPRGGGRRVRVHARRSRRSSTATAARRSAPGTTT